MAEEVTKSTQVPDAQKHRTIVCDPTGVAVTEQNVHFAPRIDSFEGKRVGLLWNGKANGNFYLQRIAELLENKYKDIQIIKFWEVDPKGTAHPDRKSDAALDRIAKSSDVVIASQAD